MKNKETNTDLSMDKICIESLNDTITAHSYWGGGL